MQNSHRTRPVISLKRRVLEKNGEDKLGLITEFKKRSPSGFIADDLTSPSEYFTGIDPHLVAGFSILTEPSMFGGSWDDLAESQNFTVPLLAKDFFDTEDMIRDSYLYGADAVLLIADFLTEDQLADLAGKASGLGMDALIEFHDFESAKRIPVGDNVLVGYNRRDLRTMKMEEKEKEAAKIFNSNDVPYILESGINSRNAGKIDFSSYSGLLIGSSIISGESVIDILAGRGLI